MITYMRLLTIFRTIYILIDQYDTLFYMIGYKSSLRLKKAEKVFEAGAQTPRLI